MLSTVIKISEDEIEFSCGIKLYSNHEQDCCESHWLSFKDLEMRDFDDLQFDLTDNGFFSKIEDYGIALLPVKGFPIRIPGYGSNNGYYSSELTLVIDGGQQLPARYVDISECQEIDG